MTKVSDHRGVVVVTGASGGIGRATARLFADRGATVALLARGERGLDSARAEIEAHGGRCGVYQVDTADPDALDRAADRIEDELGPIDIWVNVAFTSVFARFVDIEPDEFKRVTEVSYLGFVNGTRSALRRMLPRDHGTIVQVGSTLAYRGIPLQSAYCGAKHAIQGFHESLRTELLHERSAVRVTMVQMPAVNTPQFSWVLSRLPDQAQPVPPIYQPEVAARAVVYAAEHPARREYWVGASTMATLVANAVAPCTPGPLPGPHRLQFPTNRQPQTGGPAGKPVEAGRRTGRSRLRSPRALRRPVARPVRAAVGLPAPSRRGHRRDRARGGGPSRVARRTESPMRSATGVRLVLGGALLVTPGFLLTSVNAPDKGDPAALAATRLLGGRLVLQGVLDLASRGRLQRIGTAVEAAHAASLVPVAVLSADHRRTASLGVVLALGLVILDT